MSHLHTSLFHCLKGTWPFLVRSRTSVPCTLNYFRQPPSSLVSFSPTQLLILSSLFYKINFFNYLIYLIIFRLWWWPEIIYSQPDRIQKNNTDPKFMKFSLVDQFNISNLDPNMRNKLDWPQAQIQWEIIQSGDMMCGKMADSVISQRAKRN